MAKLSGMTPHNAKQNCLRLIQKLALEKVEIHRSEERIGTTYRIYSWAAILNRRRAAGMEWVTRNRGGVTFIAAPAVPSSGDTVAPVAKQPASSPDSTVIAAKAAELGVPFDDAAARQFLRRCQDADPAAREDEVAYFLELKIRQLQRRRNIENWPGLLIASVPAFFEPPATELERYGVGQGKLR